jgi:hypothetical protein
MRRLHAVDPDANRPDLDGQQPDQPGQRRLIAGFFSRAIVTLRAQS